VTRWRRFLVVGLLLLATAGLGVAADATGEQRWPYPSTDSLGTDYDEQTGETTLLFGTVESVGNGTAQIIVEYDEGTFEMTVQNFDATVQPGGAVQVYGTLEPDRTIDAERVVVVNPAGSSLLFKYGISVVAVILFLTVFFRYWRINWQSYSLEARDG
jgi:preprotein translocase subunit SecF